MTFSVIICTHNPRLDYLGRTLEALRLQSLSKDLWELIVVDNQSAEPLSERLDLTWHPSARVVVEAKLGLTTARIRGANEAFGKWLIFVDDDNVLDSEYLEQSLNISKEFPQLGVFGAAKVRPVFEVEPSSDLRPWTNVLGLRNKDRDQWSNLPSLNGGMMPIGAGMGVRADVMKSYAASQEGNLVFDRVGKDNLMSAGDFEISLHAATGGWGYGIFTKLGLSHLMPASRVDPSYLLKLNYAVEVSNGMLDVNFLAKSGRTVSRRQLFQKSSFWLFKGIFATGFKRRVFFRRAAAQIKIAELAGTHGFFR